MSNGHAGESYQESLNRGTDHFNRGWGAPQPGSGSAAADNAALNQYHYLKTQK